MDNSLELYGDCGFVYEVAWKSKSPDWDEDEYTSWSADWELAKNFRIEEYKDNDLGAIAFWMFEGSLYQLEWVDRSDITFTDNEIHVWKFNDFSDIYSDEIPTTIAKVIPSTAGKLRSSIATWYKVLRDFALVGLLSILVYIAIRMIISSATKDKVKYKKMFQGWFEAICILFVLQFLISLTFTGVQAITDIFAASVVGPSGEDKLVTDIRNDIESAKVEGSYGNAFFNIILYLVLFMYTISFGAQYLKRVVYVAFLVLIAPLIALTYPLDKINDGKAQAFEVWLKEFLFNVLIQPLHLLIYYLLIVTAKNLVTTNRLYALVAIGSLLPVEKFVRRMFGLESNSSMGNMSAALGGAAIMNSLNKIGSKGSKSSGGAHSAPKSGGTKVRTAKEGAGDAYDALKGNTQKGENTPSPGTQSLSKEPDTTPQNIQGANSLDGNNTITQNENSSNNTNPETSIKKNTNEQQGVNHTEPTAQNVKKPSNINKTPITTPKAGNNDKKRIKNTPSKAKGLWKVAKKYGGKTIRGMIKGGAKVAGALALGTIGLAAGIATGDMEKAISGAAIGLTAGSRLGGNLVDGGENLVKGAVGGAKGIRDAYREGKYGEEEAARMKFDEDFKNSSEYKNFIENHQGQEETVQDFLNAGITDINKMEKAINNGYDTQTAIAYIKMANAKDCPDTILYDSEKFVSYLNSRDIIEDLTEQRKKIKAQQEHMKQLKEEYKKNKTIPDNILENEKKFEEYLIHNGIIEDLTKEIKQVEEQTEQVEQMRRNIVTFK